jgi:VWFA-related protein
MRQHVKILAFFLAVIGAGVTSAPLRAQGKDSAGADLVRVTVTVTSRDKNEPPALAKEDVMVRQDNERRPVVDWVPAQGDRAGLDLALLVDNSLDVTLGSQFKDLTQFLRGLPPTTRVAVFYSSFGSTSLRQDFTADHDLAAKALRLPAGSINDGSSIYLSIADLLKRWPKIENRAAVLLISDGIDIFRGVSLSEAYQDMDLQTAIDQAQRNGITVFTLFASGAARYRSNFYLIGNGQGCLLRLASETGGEAYFQGSQTPIAFRPFLAKATDRFDRQYVLTFRAQPLPKPGFSRLHVTTEVPRVEMIAPARIFVPAAQ